MENKQHKLFPFISIQTETGNREERRTLVLLDIKSKTLRRETSQNAHRYTFTILPRVPTPLGNTLESIRDQSKMSLQGSQTAPRCLTRNLTYSLHRNYFQQAVTEGTGLRCQRKWNLTAKVCENISQNCALHLYWGNIFFPS